MLDSSRPRASLKCLAQALSNLAWGSIDTEAGEWAEVPEKWEELDHAPLVMPN